MCEQEHTEWIGCPGLIFRLKNTVHLVHRIKFCQLFSIFTLTRVQQIFFHLQEYSCREPDTLSSISLRDNFKWVKGNVDILKGFYMHTFYPLWQNCDFLQLCS